MRRPPPSPIAPPVSRFVYPSLSVLTKKERIYFRRYLTFWLTFLLMTFITGCEKEEEQLVLPQEDFISTQQP